MDWVADIRGICSLAEGHDIEGLGEVSKHYPQPEGTRPSGASSSNPDLAARRRRFTSGRALW
jgi:hypothetical protein